MDHWRHRQHIWMTDCVNIPTKSYVEILKFTFYVTCMCHKILPFFFLLIFFHQPFEVQCYLMGSMKACGLQAEIYQALLYTRYLPKLSIHLRHFLNKVKLLGILDADSKLWPVQGDQTFYQLLMLCHLGNGLFHLPQVWKSTNSPSPVATMTLSFIVALHKDFQRSFGLFED